MWGQDIEQYREVRLAAKRPLVMHGGPFGNTHEVVMRAADVRHSAPDRRVIRFSPNQAAPPTRTLAVPCLLTLNNAETALTNARCTCAATRRLAK